MSERTSTPSVGAWAAGISVAIIGVTWQYLSLQLVERFVTVFPSVPDVLMHRLPRVEFGLWGEALFFGLVLCFVIPHFRYQWRQTPRVLMTLGLFYFVRGWFMFLFPIGAPAGALAPIDRLNVWGYATHAYFPGGHIGILTVLTLLQPQPKLRRLMWLGVAIFGIGTLLSKNHYTMDSVAGIIVAYAMTVWVGRRFEQARSGK